MSLVCDNVESTKPRRRLRFRMLLAGRRETSRLANCWASTSLSASASGVMRYTKTQAWWPYLLATSGYITGWSVILATLQSRSAGGKAAVARTGARIDDAAATAAQEAAIAAAAQASAAKDMEEPALPPPQTPLLWLPGTPRAASSSGPLPPPTGFAAAAARLTTPREAFPAATSAVSAAAAMPAPPGPLRRWPARRRRWRPPVPQWRQQHRCAHPFWRRQPCRRRSWTAVWPG